MKNSYASLAISFSFIGFLALLGFLIGVTPTGWTTAAHAANANVAIALRSYSDLSMFYQALVNTGVMSELDENTHYTIFAPVNTAFMEISPRGYPCFYAAECRPQIAELLRDHIVVGHHNLIDLASYGTGVRSNGARLIRVEEPFVGDYTADGRRILSKVEVDGNIIYRIDGFLASRQQLARFQAISYVPDGTVTTRRTTTTTYSAPMVEPAYPGVSSAHYGPEGDNTVESTTVIQRTAPAE